METMIGLLSVVLISSLMVDWVIGSERLIRSADIPHLRPISQLSSDEFNYNLTVWFCSIFDVLYGRRTWSLKRIWRSILLSSFFVLFAVLVIGFENSYLSSSWDDFPEWPIFMTVFFGGANFAIDYISLLETRWVMECVKKRRGGFSLLTWLLFDLLLTSVIYLSLIGIILGVYVSFFETSEGLSIGIDFVLSGEFLYIIFSPHVALPFFVSTFGTSIVWFVYLVVAVTVRMTARISRVMTIFWEVTFESDSPGRIVGMLFGMFLVVVFLGLKGISIAIM